MVHPFVATVFMGGEERTDKRTRALSTKHSKQFNFFEEPMSLFESPGLHWLSGVRAALSTFSLALTFLHTPPVAAQTQEVSVSNFTPYEDVPAFVRERLSDNIKSLVRDKQLTVFVLADAYDGRKACFALAGLSYRAPNGLNPRTPSYRNFSHSVGADGEWKAAECVGSQLQKVIQWLNEAKPEALLNGLEATAEGGKRVDEPVDNTKVNLRSVNLSDVAQDAVFTTLHDHEVGALLDYRKVQAAVYATSIAFKDGDIMCTVHTGFNARTPEGRNMRWPGYTYSMVRLQTGGTPDGCIETLAPATVNEMLKQPWSAKGIFQDLDRTREAGLALPDIGATAAKRAAVLKKWAAAERATKTQQARTVSNNVLTCTNRCVNGACVRTFSNGRQERWQAPRVFNPMNQNWEWDTTTNACGG